MARARRCARIRGLLVSLGYCLVCRAAAPRSQRPGASKSPIRHEAAPSSLRSRRSARESRILHAASLQPSSRAISRYGRSSTTRMKTSRRCRSGSRATASPSSPRASRPHEAARRRARARPPPPAIGDAARRRDAARPRCTAIPSSSEAGRPPRSTKPRPRRPAASAPPRRCGCRYAAAGTDTGRPCSERTRLRPRLFAF